MQTEFTCGIYHATQTDERWYITINQYPLAEVTIDGNNIKFADLPIQLTTDCLVDIIVLMKNIKRQYKHHANTINSQL